MSSEEVKELGGDLVLCSFCNQLGINTPKLLPCKHTACLTCLNKEHSDAKDGDDIKCPKCSTIWKVPMGGFAELRDNVYAETLLEFKQLKAGKGAQCVNSCAEDPHDAPVSLCVPCGFSMCQMCFDFHRRNKTTRMHKTMNVADMTDDDVSSLQRGRYLYCSKHTNEQFRFYCQDCKVPTCRDCALGGHRNHTFCDIQDMESSSSEALDDLDKSIQGRMEKIDDDLKKMKEFHTSSKENAAEKITLIREHAQEIIDLVNNDANALIAKTEGAYSTDDELLNTFEEELQLKKVQLKSISEFVKEIHKRHLINEMVIEQDKLAKSLAEISDGIKEVNLTTTISFNKSDDIQTRDNTVGCVDFQNGSLSNILSPEQYQQSYQQYPQNMPQPPTSGIQPDMMGPPHIGPSQNGPYPQFPSTMVMPLAPPMAQAPQPMNIDYNHGPISTHPYNPNARMPCPPGQGMSMGPQPQVHTMIRSPPPHSTPPT